MVMRLLPQVAQDPQRSPAWQVQGGVVPVRDVTGSQIADAGEGLVRLGKSVTSAADLYQDQLDLAMQAQSENRLRDVLREELESPESGYLNTVGMDAVGERRKKAFDRLTAERGKIEAGLKNEAQKAGFREQADRMLSTATTLADRHQQEQVINFRFGQLDARRNNSASDAAKLVGTDEGEVSKLSALRDTEEMGKIMGWSPEKLQLEKTKVTTSLHATVVAGMLGTKTPGSAAAAATYLENNKSEVFADAEVRMRAGIESAAQSLDANEREAAAWTAANRLAKTGATLAQQRDAIDQSVRTKRMDGTTAARTWALVQNIADQKWQDLQRERASVSQQLEQVFGQDLSVTVESLPPDMLKVVDSVGMRGDAYKIQRTIREAQLSDKLSTDDNASLQLSRDVRTMGDISRLIEALEERLPDGKESATPDGVKKTKRIKAQIDSLTKQLEVMATRPRTFLTADDVAPSTSAETGEPMEPFDMKKFTDELRKTLYPGSAR